MAETLVQKIKNNAGKQWSRNTVADGNWLNSNTVQKFNENDETLANAIQEVSAAMEHFTPEITPSAWPCAANKTIQNIEQNADGSLNVTYQPIETSTTSDESLWSWYQQNAYDSVLAVYTQTENDINHKDGELSTSLTIPEGIYDVKVEVLYEPTQSTINNKLDIAISKSTSIDDALYQTFILFDDSLIKDTTSNPQKIDVQSQWITGIIDLTESTTLKFLIKGESAQGRYKLNNIYINSIGGAAGPEGPQGYTPSISTEIDTANSGTKVTFSWPAESQIPPTNFTIPSGTPGSIGPIGPQGIGLSADSSDSEYGHYVEIWKQGASQYDTRFEVRDGQDGAAGISLSAKSSTVGNVHTVEIWQEGASTAQTSFNVLDGVDGVSGTSLAAYSSKDNKTTTVVIYDPVNDPTHQSPIDTFTVLDGADGTGAGKVTNIYGINGIEASDVNGDQSIFNIGISGHCYPQELSAYSAERARAYFDPTQNTEVNFYDAFNNVYPKTETSSRSELTTEFGKYLQDTTDTFAGELTVSGSSSNFDNEFIKFKREGVAGGARIGLGSDTTNGTLALKTFNGQGGDTVQVNIKHNSNNSQLITVQHAGSDIGNLIPMSVHSAGWTPTSDDKILHIVLDS